jgi:hypothetical protein
MKVVKLSALHTGRLYPARNIPSILFFKRLSRHQGNSAAVSIKKMNNSNDAIGNRTRDLRLLEQCPIIQHLLPQILGNFLFCFFQVGEDLRNGIFFFGMSNSLINPLIYGAFHLWKPQRNKQNDSLCRYR